MADRARWPIAISLATVVSSLAYGRRTLTFDGALAATAVGTTTFARGGAPAAAGLLAFFVSSSALSRFHALRKQQGHLAQAKGARRDGWQVLANGGVAALSSALRLPGGSLGALAAAAADTWATEVGMLARSRPRLITSLREVEPGRSGAVTLEGFAASAGGALVVAGAWAIVARSMGSMLVALVSGVAGALVDSFLGATVQALYRCGSCGTLVEQPYHATCDSPADLVRGAPWMTNDVVNGCATLAGALIGLLLWPRTPNAAEHELGGGGRASPRRHREGGLLPL